MSKKSISGEAIKLSKVRLSYPQLHAPARPKGMPDAKESYGANFLLDPNDPAHRETIKKINAEIKRLRAEAWGKGGERHPKEEELICFGKGETRVNDEGEVYKGYEGMYYVAAKNYDRPRCVNRAREDITDPKEIEKMFYAGCYVTASVNFWVQDNAAGKAIRCGLRGVQFHSDGEAFGGSRASDDEFDDIGDDDGLFGGDIDDGLGL